MIAAKLLGFFGLHKKNIFIHLAGFAALAAMNSLRANEFDLGPIQAETSINISSGATWRLQNRANQFIGKSNIQGQQNLCAKDDCLSFTGDPSPNQRLVNAAGGYYVLNADNGNLNYDRGDIVYATTKFTPKVNLTWGNWQLKGSITGFYDPVNYDFDETHPNTRFQLASTPRAQEIKDEFALGYKRKEIALSGFFDIGDHQINISAGDQVIRWGEANTLLFSTLSMINPLDASIARMPGFQIKELPIPVPALIVGGSIVDNLSAEIIWMYGWKPTKADPVGSFMSTNDIAGGGHVATAGLGQFSEDPNGQFSVAFPASLVSSTSATDQVLPESTGYPDNHDEYGIRLNYIADWINSGTELGFYYLHYNSRLPYASVYASDKSCARDSPDAVQALIDCQGFNGSFQANLPVHGLEPIPIDTEKILLEYPEHLNLAGVSFNTTIGSWAAAGELAYHYQLPIQVAIVDVVYAGLQPAFPRQDIHIGVSTLTDIAAELPVGSDLLVPITELIAGTTAGTIPGLTIPGARSIVPDFLSVYRGLDIQPHQLIHGYEKRDVIQLTLNGLKAFRENPFGADQILLLVEGGLTHVVSMPKLGELQFEGGGDNTHASPGADGTGTGGVPDPRRFNPTQQTEGFATENAFGYRILTKATYSSVFGRYSVQPTILFQHDVYGTSPYPMQNFIERRKSVWTVVDVELNQKTKLELSYQMYTGASKQNLLIDRDNIGVAIILDF